MSEFHRGGWATLAGLMSRRVTLVTTSKRDFLTSRGTTQKPLNRHRCSSSSTRKLATVLGQEVYHLWVKTEALNTLTQVTRLISFPGCRRCRRELDQVEMKSWQIFPSNHTAVLVPLRLNMMHFAPSNCTKLTHVSSRSELTSI